MSTHGALSGLFTDLYELTMAQAYEAEGMLQPATFSLFYRTLPEHRNYVLACGIERVIEGLLELRFSEADLDYLRSEGTLSDRFVEYLTSFRFSGDVHALPEGTPVFPGEPLVEVTAPVAEAQILETWIMNQVHGPSVLASKAARVVAAADGRPVLDFGMRRSHGADGAVEGARALRVAGVAATSNVLAGRRYGLPIAGTMAHSYVQAHDDELQAFRTFARQFPETVLLVDTYDTLAGVDKVIELADELGDGFRVRGIRLDSGDLDELSRRARARLDEHGLESLQIFASGGLDEIGIRRLVNAGAPIDGFGVGTKMAAAADAPTLDMAYKMVGYADRGRMKLSSGKDSLPGRKQVLRSYDAEGGATGDVLARRDERGPGRPLLEPFMVDGSRVREAESADTGRQRAAREIDALPAAIRGLERPPEPYPVTLSRDLEGLRDEVRTRLEPSSG